MTIRPETLRLPQLPNNATDWDRTFYLALADQMRELLERSSALETTVRIAPRRPGTIVPLSTVTHQTLIDAATINWDVDEGHSAQVTLGGNRTFAAPTNLEPGNTYILEVIQDGTGSRTITWNAVFKWPGGVAPTLTTTAGAIDIISFWTNGTNLYGVGQLAFS